MNPIKSIFSLILLTGFMFIYSSIINIPDDFADIQSGINISADGDTVLIQPGIYNGGIDFLGKNIIVGSLFLTTQDTTFIAQTMIDGGSPVVTFSSEEDSSAVLAGLTISGGYFSYQDFIGGGIRITNNSYPTLTNLIVTENEALEGVAIYCSGAGFSIDSSIVQNNHSAMGGMGIILIDDGICDFSNCLITENSTSNIGSGFLFYGGSNIVLSSTIVSNNSSESGGGGLLIYGNCNVVFDPIERCSIFDNNSENSSYFAKDIQIENDDFNSIILDTFTVMNPSEYYAYPNNFINFDILNSTQGTLIESEVYVSPDGSDSNTGINPEFPFESIPYAVSRIYSDSSNVNTINLLPGVWGDKYDSI